MTEFDVLGDYLVVGNNNGTLSVWDLNTAQMMVNILSQSLVSFLSSNLCFQCCPNLKFISLSGFSIPPYTIFVTFLVFILVLKILIFQLSKQLFGIVTGVRCLEEEKAIVTTHAGFVNNLGSLLVLTNAKLSIRGKSFAMRYQYLIIRQGF